VTGFDVFPGHLTRWSDNNDRFPLNIMTEDFFRLLGGPICAAALIGEKQKTSITPGSKSVTILA
jgi:hypothetical protein